MTILYGLCWNIDSRKIIWPPRAHFGSENESLKGLIDNRRWKQCQCRNQNRLALLCTVMTSDITRYYSDIIYHYFNIFPPWRQKNREARSTALQPIRLITKRVVAGRHCIYQLSLYWPSFNMPIWRHFWKRQAWHAFLLRFVITQLLVAGHVYSMFPASQ